MSAEIVLNVSYNGMYTNAAATVSVADVYQYCFEPLHTTDDPLLSAAPSQPQKDGPAAQQVLKARKDAADILARHIAEMIVFAMGKDDTHNGYPKEKANG